MGQIEAAIKTGYPPRVVVVVVLVVVLVRLLTVTRRDLMREAGRTLLAVGGLSTTVWWARIHRSLRPNPAAVAGSASADVGTYAAT